MYNEIGEHISFNSAYYPQSQEKYIKATLGFLQGAMMQSPQSSSVAPDTGEPKSVDIIKVSARSRSTAVAGAVAGVVREHNRAEVQAIGAGAVNQAVKAIAIARGYLREDGINVIVIPYFTEVMIDGQERTAVRLTVEPR
jgi:stage V sporulation protein S